MAVSAWVPAAITGMVKVAVEGEAAVTVPVPWLTPSNRNVTLPVGLVAAGLDAVIVAETSRELPAVGASVAGVATMVVGLLLTVIVTAADTEDA